MAHPFDAIDPSHITLDKDAAAVLWEMTWNKGEGSLFAVYTPLRDLEDRRASSEVRVWGKFWALSMPRQFQDRFMGAHAEGILIRREYETVLRDAIACASDQPETTFDSRNRKDDDDDPLAEVKNPFSEPEALRAILPRIFIPLGHPGVGKTLWLYYTLVLRLAVGLPTIFVNNPNHLYTFNHSGAFIFKDYESPFEDNAGEMFKCCITRDCWCLVDSNAHLIGVPEFIMSQNRFVVQAASPHAERTKWTQKTPYEYTHYFMRPWTLSELIAGFNLASALPSEAEFAAYYARHIPSARTAYQHARAESMPLFEDKIREDLKDLSFERFRSLLTTLSTMRVGNPEISHNYILVAPMPGKRTTFTTDVPSRYVFELIRSKTIVWSATDDRPSVPAIEYLHLGCISPLRSFILISDKPLENPAYRPLGVRAYDPYDRQLQLDDGYYYRPNPDFQAIFNGFIYTSSTQTATLFQATVSPDHPMSLREIGWLQELGVVKFDYIIVTPPGPIQVPISISVNQYFGKKHQIIVKSLDLGPDLPTQPEV
ncbi:hypothetical protein BOTBODRAFT_177771 [Botryobasidium botryosum FD-172 SS1]|uniref:Uncharacterized protein n=1 Tax=Botryobasidium botryosum (strain FD-172 SS1) TaxID=930990 RepID=A0A067M5S7_BOTB1|nr:hypothetical protein BOTBODRAFT_177771 [Botryobasidium botryosum FD-172 SS1]